MKRRDLPTDSQLERTVAFLRAIAHPVRLLVLLALRGGPLSVTRLQSLSRCEQSALSHQLRTLRDARLVRAERSGRQVLYALHDDHVLHVLEDALTHATETGA